MFRPEGSFALLPLQASRPVSVFSSIFTGIGRDGLAQRKEPIVNYYRQGDIAIIPVKGRRPKGAKLAKRDNGRIVLAYGEVTGHAHAILDNDAELWETAAAADRFLRVRARGGAVLVHEEHAPIALPKGDYIVRHQREYSPEELRRVAD